MRSVRVGLIGDYDPAVIAHQAIPQALALAGDARIVELAGHPFFLATLFQPERSAFSGRVHPLILGYVQALLG